MKLSELKLNRWGYREHSVKEDNFNDDARNILSGTVITSCIVQSSPGPNRIELSSSITNPNPLDQAPSYITATDNLIAYKDNTIVAAINQYGIFTENLYAMNLVFTNVSAVNIVSSGDVSAGDRIIYRSRVQPRVFVGRVKYDGTASSIPTGWSVTKTAVGKYFITHNLNNLQYFLSVTDFSESGGPAQVIAWTTLNPGANSFEVHSYDVATGNATDSSFYFQLFEVVS